MKEICNEPVELPHELLEEQILVEGTDRTPLLQKLLLMRLIYLIETSPPTNKLLPTAQDRHAVDCAIEALDAIKVFRTYAHYPWINKLFMNAWHGIWKWLHFLDAQCCQPAKYGHKVQSQALCTIALTVETLCRSPAVFEAMLSTPGVVALISRNWIAEDSSLIIDAVFAPANEPVSCLFAIALDALVSNPTAQVSLSMAEVILAAGGREVVAKHAVDRIKAALEETPDFVVLFQHLSLIANLTCTDDNDSELLLCALELGMIPLLIRTLLWIHKQSPATSKDEELACRSVGSCCLMMEYVRIAPKGPIWVIQALNSGLIPAILKSAHRISNVSERHPHLASILLCDTLCSFLIYRSVVHSASRALRKLEKSNLESLAGPIWDAWIVFKNLAYDRAFLKNVDSEESFSDKKNLNVFCRARVCYFI